MKSTRTIRRALSTMTAAFAANDLARVRNAARWALSQCGRSDLMPSKANTGSRELWALVIEFVELECQKRELANAAERALFARNLSAAR